MKNGRSTKSKNLRFIAELKFIYKTQCGGRDLNPRRPTPQDTLSTKPMDLKFGTPYRRPAPLS